jgi:hypothetical protein
LTCIGETPSRTREHERGTATVRSVGDEREFQLRAAERRYFLINASTVSTRRGTSTS